VILAAHGLQTTLPPRWSGRIFRRDGANATLHAGDFRLALDDGEFGDRSTGAMPRGTSFLALVEYLPGAGLVPGKGLYRSRSIPLPLDPTAFSPRKLAHIRPGQVGLQHFFTAAGRPFCLYVVISGADAARDGSRRRRQLVGVDAVLRSLRFGEGGGT
jgi:hypothetical protein